jgi:hypothetical protein
LPVILVHTPGDGVHFIDHPKPDGNTWFKTPETKGRLFRGRGRTSLGPVLMYADIFIRSKTLLDGVAEAFALAYPGLKPRMRLDRDDLVTNYIIHIMPVDPATRPYEIPLWQDLTDHGLNRLAQTILLAAQEISYRDATGDPPPESAKRFLRDLARSLRPSPTASALPNPDSSRGSRRWCP